MLEKLLENSLVKVGIMKRNVERDKTRIKLLENDLVAMKNALEGGSNKNDKK